MCPFQWIRITIIHIDGESASVSVDKRLNIINMDGECARVNGSDLPLSISMVSVPVSVEQPSEISQVIVKVVEPNGMATCDAISPEV